MKTYSSTILKYFDQNCPAALGKAEAREPRDTQIFQAGIAAHAIMQAIAQKEARTYADQETVADAVVNELITVGRAFNNIPEPPMSPSDAIAGREIALNYLAWRDLPLKIRGVEIGIGMLKDGGPCCYDDASCRYRALIDLTYADTIGDEDWQAEMLVVADYKSAWPAGEGELDTLQRKGQAVLVWINFCQPHHPVQYHGIRQEVINLRTGMSFTRDILFDDEGIALLERWRKDILMACTAASKTRQARPGAGCLSCPYTLSCDDSLFAYKGDGITMATQLAAIEAIRGDLIKVLKGKAKNAGLPVHNGYVGFRKQDKQVPIKEAYRILAEYWFAGDADLETLGLLKGMSLTKANIENAVNVVYPKRDKDNAAVREDIFAAILETKSESRFGVHPNKPIDIEDKQSA